MRYLMFKWILFLFLSLISNSIYAVNIGPYPSQTEALDACKNYFSGSNCNISGWGNTTFCMATTNNVAYYRGDRVYFYCGSGAKANCTPTNNVLNADGSACVPVPTCKSAETLNTSTNTCIAPTCTSPQVNDPVTGACVTPPPTITSLSATQGTVTGKVTLTWIPDASATNYEVWRSTTSGGTGTKIATLTAPASGYNDTTVTGASSYFYTVKIVINTQTGAEGNQVEGWANRAPTAATAALTTDSTTASAATAPAITDPNVTAGQTETFTLAITTQPNTGTLTLVNNNFVYTPPANGAFSGSLTFAFTATDKGGESVTGSGTINVLCDPPTISTLNLPITNVLESTSFDANSTYTFPACSNNSKVKLDILNSSNAVVNAGTLTSITNGTNLTRTFTTTGIANLGNYTVRLTASSDSGTVTKTASLTVDAVHLPTLSVSPSLSVNVGETITAALNEPADVNCPLTINQSIATSDHSKCYVSFTSIPTGLVLDNSGTLPALSGPIESGGSITAEIYKHNGTALAKVGQVSKTVVAQCLPPSITTLNIPDLLPHDLPNYNATYKAYSCNGTLTGSLTIKKSGNLIETLSLSSLDRGTAATLTKVGTGLPAGNYTAELNITGTSGTDSKAQAFQVRPVPLPALTVNPSTASQGETLVEAKLTQSSDTSCSLTTVQAQAQASSNKCFVALSTTAPDMIAGSDANGLPTLKGYPTVAGDYTVTAAVSRWVDGTRYDLSPLTETLKVTPVVQPTFSFTGKKSVYAFVEPISLIFKQETGSTCLLFESKSLAQDKAAQGQRACFVIFTGDTGLTKSLSSLTNQYKIEGKLTATGPIILSYSVKRQSADGVTTLVQSGDFTITVKALEPPVITLKGGTKITDGKYYVSPGDAITNAIITAGAVPTNARMKFTVTDSKQTFTRDGLTSGSAYPLTTPNLGLLEERPLTLRAAWQDYPAIFNEQIITAVGGAENGMKLTTEVPKQVADTDLINVKVKVGKIGKEGLIYTPTTMGQWRTQIMAQTSSQAAKSPITEMKNMVNGETTFQIFPASNSYLKLTAVSELISTVSGVASALTSSTSYVEVVKGSAIQGVISSKSFDGPAPKSFTLNLDLTDDNKRALKEVSWEESVDFGVTWVAAEKSNGLRYSVNIDKPGSRKVRAKMINKNTLVVSYTPAVKVLAYSKVDAAVTGPQNIAPNATATWAGELYREGVLTTNTVNEWTVEAPSGTKTVTGATVSLTEAKEGKINITLKTRLATTRADDASAWSTAKYLAIVKAPEKPRVSVDGPRDVEVGQTYHYEGTVLPSWGNMTSTNTLVSEWQKPNGTTVPGASLDWTPTANELTDKKPLIFRAWVDGYKDSTSNETTVNYLPWQYIWPNFSLSMKQLSVKAPTDISLIVDTDQPSVNKKLEGLTYDWTIPYNITGKQNAFFPNRAAVQITYSGTYVVSVAVRDARGHETILSQHIFVEKAVPYDVALKITPSNMFNRVPMTITVRPSISGGHPLDEITTQAWAVDGVPVDLYVNRGFMISDIIDTGDHTISYTLNSRMGESKTVEAPLSLVANKPPVCTLSTRPSSSVVYVEASCTDPDGKVIGYTWKVDGEQIGSTSYRISFNRNSTPITSKVVIVGMDDARKLSTPVSINVDY